MLNSNYGFGTSKPEAYITRSKTKSRGRLKVYSNNTIYLENGEEFEIEIFNPTSQSILAKIEINGSLISSTGLVLKPAQRVFLERYFDVDRRFKFDVYEVENWEKLKKEAEEITNNRVSLDKELSLRKQLLELTTSESERDILENKINELKTQTDEMKSLETELNQRGNDVQKATKNNGKIRVLFYKEKMRTHNHPNWILLNSSYGSGTTLGGYNSSLNTTTSNIGRTFSNNNLRSKKSLDNNIVNDSLSEKYNYSDNSETTPQLYSSLFQTTSFNSEEIISDNTKSLDDYKETGRVEQGSVSNQKFETVNMEFEYITFHTVEYTVLPVSEKPMEVKDLRKYCTNCGKKLSPSDNFCSSCGNRA